MPKSIVDASGMAQKLVLLIFFVKMPKGLLCPAFFQLFDFTTARFMYAIYFWIICFFKNDCIFCLIAPHEPGDKIGENEGEENSCLNFYHSL